MLAASVSCCGAVFTAGRRLSFTLVGVGVGVVVVVAVVVVVHVPLIYTGCWLHVSPRCGAVHNFR